MENLKLRDRLAALADEVGPQTSVPSNLVPRARRRAILVVGSTIVVVALVSVGMAAGVRSILRAEDRRPALPQPPGVVSADVITIVAMPHEGTAPSGAVVVDPDGGPNPARSLGLATSSIPLGWSPDGERLLIAFPSGALAIHERDGRFRNLDVETSGFWGASWSPDGMSIVFGSAIDENASPFGSRTSLRVVDSDGGSERVLLQAGPNERFLYPSWSPDGSTIAFLRTKGFSSVMERSNCDAACERANDRGTELWIVNADGSDPRPVINDVSLRASSYNAPAWSPDGVKFLFSAYAGTGEGDVQVFVGDADSSPIQITTGPGDALAPTWAPDGSLIAFIRQVGEDHELHVAEHTGENERSPLSSLAFETVYERSSVLWDSLPAG